MSFVSHSLRLTLWGLAPAALGVFVACSDSPQVVDADPPDASSDGQDAGRPPAPTHDADAPSDTQDSGTAKDAGDSGDSGGGEPAKATFKISGTFANKKGKSGDYFYDIDISIQNTSDEDVASLDTLTYGFGDGKEVSLTKPACNGKFALRAGKVATIATQIGVAAADGSLKDYSNFCSPSQYFGGATGSAPPTDTFAGPITLTIGGKTKNGTFSGTGTATQ